MSHTPGPWEVMPRFSNEFIIPSCDAGKSLGGASDPDVEAARYAKTIARVHGSEYTNFSRSRVMIEERAANARLIAAAPELLSALINLLSWSERVTEFHGAPAQEDARAAIAKAEGVKS